jgi:hypothetical protein
MYRMSQDFKVNSAGRNFEPVIRKTASSAVEFVLWVVVSMSCSNEECVAMHFVCGFCKSNSCWILAFSPTTKPPSACVHSGSRTSAIKRAPLRMLTAAMNVNYNEMWRKTHRYCRAKPRASTRRVAARLCSAYNGVENVTMTYLHHAPEFLRS